jgi:hypothetical protein
MSTWQQIGNQTTDNAEWTEIMPVCHSIDKNLTHDTDALLQLAVDSYIEASRCPLENSEK